MESTTRIYLFIMCIITYYAVAKEREELGCYRISIARQCDDQNSVYVYGTKPSSKDTRKILISRMKSVLSYHEKAGVWRRCFILGIVLTIIAYSIVTSCSSSRRIAKIHNWFIVHIMFVAILYFFFNYINYHHMRNLKNNGLEILNMLIK